MFGHNHTLTLPVTVGPLALRVLLMLVVPAIAGFAVLRGFLPEPGRRARAALAVGAAAAVLVELMLARYGLRVPDAVVPVLLAGIAVPVRVALTRRARSVATGVWLDRIGRVVLPVATLVAGAQFVRGWGTAVSGAATALQVTGVVVGVVGLAWYATSRLPRARLLRLATQVVAVVLAVGTLGGAGEALALTLADAQPRTPPSTKVRRDAVAAGWRVVDRAAR